MKSRRFLALLSRRRQSGQAIVLLALMMLVLLGMVGIAVDGGRGYVDRRELQDAVDAAALAAGDNYLNTDSVYNAEAKASYEFAANERITGFETDTNFGTDNASASWQGYPGTFTIQVTHNAFNGTNFLVNATHQITLSFMQVLGIGPQISTATVAKSVIASQAQTPALLTLATTCQSGSNASLDLIGGAQVSVVGALYANGSVSSNSTSAQVNVAGNAFDGQCYPTGGTIPNVVPYCYDGQTNPPTSYQPSNGVCPIVNGYQTVLGQEYTGAPPLPDPGYAAPPVTGLPLVGSIGNNVIMKAGEYTFDPKFTTALCWFQQPGVYEWDQGFTLNHGLVSNELRPPDEASVGTVTTTSNPGNGPASNRAGQQFWHGNSTDVVNCDGNFEVAPVTSHGGGVHPLNPGGTWGVIVTSLRFDSYKGTSYNRQSAPSVCRTVAMDGHTTGFQVAVSNVPGAQYYDVYASPTGCGGPFGYAGSVCVAAGCPTSDTTVEQNTNTGGCPALPPYPTTNGAPIVISSNPGSIEPSPVATGYLPNCSLGYTVSDYFDSTNIGGQGGIANNGNFNVNTSGYCPLPLGSFPPPFCQYPTGSPSAAGVGNDGGEQPPIPPPPGSPTLPQESGIQDLLQYGGGDRANENECRLQGSQSIVTDPCLGTTVTPGAVQWYFPPNQCLNVQGSTGGTYGDAFIFGGRQYLGIVLYAPPQNTCSSMKLAGGSETTLIGTIYMPSASFSVTGGAHSAVVGQVIVSQAQIDGSSGTAITYDPSLAPPAPGARLII